MSDEVRLNPPNSEVEVEPAPGIEKEIEEREAQRRSASLWSDAWRQLRRRPIFLISAILIIILITMAIVPQLFTSKDPA